MSVSLAKKKLITLKTSIVDILIKVASEERKYIEELNREQLIKGINADGTSTPSYVSGSKSPSAPGKIKRLETGEFFDSLFAEPDKQGITIFSTDEKANFMDKWGEAKGLTRESQDKLIERMRPRIIEEIKLMLNK